MFAASLWAAPGTSSEMLIFSERSLGVGELDSWGSFFLDIVPSGFGAVDARWHLVLGRRRVGADNKPCDRVTGEVALPTPRLHCPGQRDVHKECSVHRFIWVFNREFRAVLLGSGAGSLGFRVEVLFGWSDVQLIPSCCLIVAHGLVRRISRHGFCNFTLQGGTQTPRPQPHSKHSLQDLK